MCVRVRVYVWCVSACVDLAQHIYYTRIALSVTTKGKMGYVL